ncbi:zinc ribbon domain-containing protein [Fructobacillus americanaquae]|uniref:Zinc ribbon domain-containing protein n=1 Tax=Fructobacillus americanaquae TaxID=2940302 RepID=A0ABY5C0L7_9LACO|nr:zinc ribbon domain-containing protein [Fructobacillus americanaquae]USS92142.1 zinc ribbon domain-containing protein [Fructobacillus americanaquae]
MAMTDEDRARKEGITQDGVTKIDYMASILFFWVKGYVEVDNRVIKVQRQNTIAHIIPAGEDKQVFRLDNVQGSSQHTSYKLFNFIVGALIAFFGVESLGSNAVLGIVLAVFGVIFFLNGIVTELVINGNGSNYFVGVTLFDKQKVIDINQKIQEALIYGQDAHDNNRVMANANMNSQAMIDAIRDQNNHSTEAQEDAQKQRTTFCSQCGAKIDGQAKFCPSCGAPRG